MRRGHLGGSRQGEGGGSPAWVGSGGKSGSIICFRGTINRTDEIGSGAKGEVVLKTAVALCSWVGGSGVLWARAAAGSWGWEGRLQAGVRLPGRLPLAA